MAHPPAQAPSVLNALAEQWSVVELMSLQFAGPWRGLIPQGHGEPVLVLPGFTGSDRSTRPLRQVLKARGFHVHGWGLGQNFGPHPRVVDGLRQRLAALHDRHGRPISVVGWSLGGIYARELARAEPDAVRQVITLASPFRFRSDDRGRASRLYDQLAPAVDPFPDRLVQEHEREPLPVPTTAIYTRTDGVVAWRTCIETAGVDRENISVVGTHNGLGFNFGALVAVADRLAQPAGTWTPFRPPLILRGWYRRPASWQDA